MKKRRGCYKKLKFTYMKTTLLALFVCLLFGRGYTVLEQEGENYFHVFINGIEIGTVGDRDQARELLVEARRNIASESAELTFIDVDMSLTGEEVMWGVVDEEEELLAAMEGVLRANVRETLHRSYTMKVNEYMVSLASVEEVQSLLQTAIDNYDSEGKFGVELVYDSNREFSVLTTHIVERGDTDQAGEGNYMNAGIQSFFSEMGRTVENTDEKEFSDYELGLKSMGFTEEVEIVESYLAEGQLSNLEDAVNEVTKEQETPSEYLVVSGDTLSEIAIKVNIPMERIIEMNKDVLEDENSTIRAGQTLFITVPEPELSVERMEENYYEETYEADIIYIDNDSWYTNHSVELQSPSAGFRQIVADVYYVNGDEVYREILKEEIIMEAVPKIVERGTIVPPSYIRPISGGRQTSAFGRRAAPTKGASTYHKGVDWAVPTGTSVYASSGGVVVKAGWGSGYGYVVYIDHPDGRQTRYGHLSKVLVSVGQTVKQGDRIALSGNTGVSTGPHLHFEILINGTQQDPLKYLNK
ncbi:MAG: M23 family metallopeptidase [Candidatus Gastranaerophilales bacterium]|nr:M23 family metallopeptidase [Candidatus Gastranaerophilales bacterium]